MRFISATELIAEYKDALQNPDSRVMKVRQMAAAITEQVKSATTLPAQSSDDVKVRGEKLSRIKWKGRQWAVTSHGLERRDGCYHIALRDFFDGHPWAPSPYHGWMKHIGEKARTDIEDLRDALIAFSIIHDKRRIK